jgi:hypothetical protein
MRLSKFTLKCRQGLSAWLSWYDVLYLAKGFVARNRKTREMVAVKGVDYEDKLHVLMDLWNEERIQFTRHHFVVQEPIDVSVVLHWNMVGSVGEAVTLALAGFGTEQSKAGDNTMHIGGEQPLKCSLIRGVEPAAR